MKTIKLNYIANIVFYIEQETKEKRTKVFLKNGTIIDTNYEEGINICEELVKDRHITSVEEFKKIINNDFVHVTSEKSLEENIEKYKPNKPFEDPISKEDILKDFDEYKTDGTYGAEDDTFGVEEEDLESINKIFSEDNNEEDDENEIVLPPTKPINIGEVEEDDEYQTIDDIDLDEDNELSEKDEDDFKSIEEIFSSSDKDELEYDDEDNYEDSYKSYDDEDTYDNNYDNLPDNYDVDGMGNEISNDNLSNERGIKGFFKRLGNKIKNTGLVKKITLGITSIALALGIGIGAYSCASRKSPEGVINKNNISNSDSSNKGKSNSTVLFVGDNKYYDDYTFNQLIEVTEDKTQKRVMTKANKLLEKFNIKFASKYNKSKIKPALSFYEIVALQNAYNDYSKEDIASIYNGEDVLRNDLSNDYKEASLQLMGAYIIETKDNPVDISDTLDTQKGKEFWDKYHNLFVRAKNATGNKQLELVKEFYNNVKKDFPVTVKRRTEGISHREDHNSIESYKLSVAPIIAAAEMIFQKLDVDYTLKNSEVHFLNDIGLCDYAEEKFERIEIITLSSETNKKSPLYDQYKEVVENELIDKDSYGIKDKLRELSKLEEFRLAVNGRFHEVATGSYKKTSKTVKNTSTTYSEKTSTRNIPIPKSEKKKIDNQIEKENAEAKKKGLKKAEENRKKMQAKENKNAKKVRESVKKDAKDMQDKIDQANNKINNGGTVNEKDFKNHNVDFDDKYSDSNGNLDKSVGEITTDGSNDKTNEPLPNPNKTGASFDSRAQSKNEKIVDQYISKLENETSSNEDGYQYKR